MRALPLALALLLMAGCLSFGNDRPDYAAEEQRLVAQVTPLLVQDHGTDRGHADAAQHVGAFNLALVGYHNGLPGSGQDPNDLPAGATYNELVVTPHYAYLARGSADGSVGGFTILSHKNAANPGELTYVGEFDALPGADLEVNADETLAFFATQRNTPQQILAGGQASQSAGALLPRGILTVDISDKKAPRLESFTPLPLNGPHTITYWTDGTNQYVIACTYDLITDPNTGALLASVPVTQRVIVFQVQRVAGSGFESPWTLVPISQFQITDSAPAGKLYFPHDTRVQLHPTYDGGNAALLYVAYWDKGVRILDFRDPMNLREIGFFTEFGPTSLNNIHLAQAFDEPVGKGKRHITVAEPEIPASPDETGQITILDTTDPTHPEQLGYWTLPNGTSDRLGVTAFDFSPHNFDLWDGKIALAHNHAGVWVIDVSDDENLAAPKSVGYYMPTKPRENSPAPQPMVWGVFEEGGLLWASDAATGLYVLRYTGP